MLMLSGVLKSVVERDPGRRFQLIRRTGYGTFLKHHPAIASIGFLPARATVQRVDYWSMEKLGPGEQRAYQVLARGFGLPTPAEERLWIPEDPTEDPLLETFLPRDRPLVAIAPSSDSPRKAAAPHLWHTVVDRLLGDELRVVQLGRVRDVHVRNTYSLRGLTTPRQAIALLRRANLLITSDNFLMHAAHLTGTPAVVLWGPTDHRVYGYSEHVHLQFPKACGLAPGDDCVGPERNEGGKAYGTSCPEGKRHCIDQLEPEAVYQAARRAMRYSVRVGCSQR